MNRDEITVRFCLNGTRHDDMKVFGVHASAAVGDGKWFRVYTWDQYGRQWYIDFTARQILERVQGGEVIDLIREFNGLPGGSIYSAKEG